MRKAFFLFPAMLACVAICFGGQERERASPKQSADGGQPVVPLWDNLGTGNGAPKDGYWALEPDPASDPTGQNRHGRLRALPPPQYLDLTDPAAMPIVADWTSQQFDDYALFYFRDQNGNSDPTNPHRPRILSNNYPLNIAEEVAPLVFYADTGGIVLNNVFASDSAQLYVYDLTLMGGQSYTAQLLATIWLGSQGFVLDQNSTMTWTAAFGPGAQGPTPTEVRVLFRYFPDGTDITYLDEGEVALFQDCNYQGKAAVFIADTADFSGLTTGVTTLDKTAASIKLGNNTAVTLYSGAGFSATRQVIKTDTACLDQTPIGRETTSIQPAPLLPIALSSKACENCKLEGVNVTGVNLSGIDFTSADLLGATLTNANLTGTILNGATLINATMTGATFNGTHLINAFLDGALGLEGVDLSHAVVASGVSLQGVNLTNAVLSGAQLDSANLTGATLTGVTLQGTNLQKATLDKALGLVGADLTPAQFSGATFRGTNLTNVSLPANFDHVDLTGATLIGVPLQNITLDNAIFDRVIGLAGADLSKVGFSNTSLRHVNLSGAKLYGAQLNNANLDGANLSGADLTKSPSGDALAANLQGAFLRNVNLSQAQLSGAIFTNASFYSTNAVGTGTCTPDPETGFTSNCATAKGAVMNNTQLGSAYLFGVDFTGAQIQGVQFTNAVLAGANFNGATIAPDSTIGADSGFSGAFLQGTNLQTATLLGEISLASAFVDFSANNTIYLILSPDHTLFPGYWNAPGEPVCAEMFYNNASFMPTDNSMITCPDGLPHTNGCGNPSNPDGSPNQYWNSSANIFYTGSGQPTQGQVASYQFPATFTNSPASGNAVCTFDHQWIPLETSLRREPRPPKRPNPKAVIPASSTKTPTR
jgi:uncharacterized protein YjbI with pentapeptide repeats